MFDEPNSHRADWLVVCDFDGTIVEDDLTDVLLARHASPRWKNLERDWIEGRISARTCLARQVELVSGGPEVFDALAASASVRHGFEDFVLACRVLGLPLIIASDGLDRIIDPVMLKTGQDAIPVYANRVVHTCAGWIVEAPFGAPGCASGTCKCFVARSHARRLSGRALRILLIGDGRSDMCLAGQAAHVIACGALLDHCRTGGIPHDELTDFRAAIRVLQRLAVRSLA